jgi:hypothetical protein
MPDRAGVARRRAPSLRPLLLLTLICATCSGGTPSGEVPQPAEMVPSAGYATTPTAVKITGSNFLAQAKQQASGGAPTLDTSHRAWLDDVELQDVTWVSTTELTATVPAGLAVGAHRLTVENAMGERGTLDGAFTVLPGSSFSAAVAFDRTTVTEGQAFHLTLTLANDGGADVTDLALGIPSVSSPDGADATPSGAAPDAPATLAVGDSQTFTWTYVATKAGHLSATVGATGKDASSGAALDAAPAAAAQVVVQTPPELRAELSIPEFVPVSSATEARDFTVTIRVANSGGADAVEVAPTAPATVAGSVPVSPKDGPAPASATVPAGQAVSFTWTFTAGTSIGSLQLSGGADGRDANSGGPVSAPAVTSGSAHVGNAAIIATIKSAPAHATIGADGAATFPVVVTFRNPGTQSVTQFSTRATVTDAGVAVSGPTPFPGTLAPGDTDLTWSVRSFVAGELVITFSADGRDGAQPVSGSATVTVDVSSPP